MTRPHAQHLAAWIFGSTSFLFLVSVFVFGPNELPPPKHQMLGFFCALAAGFLGYFVVGLVNVAGTIKLPLFGRIKVKAAGAAAFFVLVLLWWQSPIAPVKSAPATKEDLASFEQRLREFLQPKHDSVYPTHRELPPELIEKAKLLLARGDKEQKALGYVALKNHAKADELIQELKRQPLEDAFRVLTLEGNNWYNAGQFDRAIEPYEQGMALRPTDVSVRHSAALAHWQAQLGDIAQHQARAISILEGTLPLIPSHSTNWGVTQSTLGSAWFTLPTGDRGENLRRAVAAFEAALTVFTRDAQPERWALAQGNLGVAWANMPSGERGENLRRAISAYEADMTIRTRDTHPVDWAITQNNLGLAWDAMPAGDPGENRRRAVAIYEAALRVCTRNLQPLVWASLNHNLGVAYAAMPTGDPGENLRRAVAAYKAALTVRVRARPMDWAATHHNLADAQAELAEVRGENRCERFREATASWKAALQVPMELDAHLAIMGDLERARKSYESGGCAASVLFKDIRPAD